MPYVATFASFLALLCCEQIRTDVAYPGLPVRLIGHHAGITLGFYGTSHHATEDIAIMRSIAGLAVVAPADGPSLAAALRATVDHARADLLPHRPGPRPEVYGPDLEFELGKAIVHSAATDLTHHRHGLDRARRRSPRPRRCAREGRLGRRRSTCTRSSRSTARRVLARRRARRGLLMTVEEHNVLGGLGGAVAEVLTEAGAGVRLHRHGIHDEFSSSARRRTSTRTTASTPPASPPRRATRSAPDTGEIGAAYKGV